MDTPESRIRWWQDARFGMFIHWGLYTIDGFDCWKMHNMGIPVEEYVKAYEPRFRPDKFDARALARLARSAGCKYVVMGTRHHEGYCLWDTRTTPFSSVSMTPKRDFIREYVDAVREEGLKVGFYYSLLDWRYKAYWEGPRRNAQGWNRLVEYVHDQVRELMTLYGKIDILWYDGAWPPHDPGPALAWGFLPTDPEVAEAWRSEELNAQVRALQPDILVNNRSYVEGDFGTPEQSIVAEGRPWELCDSMGDMWGAAPQDLNHKTPREIITRLITCVAQSGNMLLNIGPNADGSVQEWQGQIMARIGEWMEVHGEAIYGCSREPQHLFTHGLAPWRTTRKADTLYLHLLRYPGRFFSIANLHNLWLESATLLDTGQPLEMKHEPTRDVIAGLPDTPPDDIATVVKLQARPKSEAERTARGSIALDDPDNILRRQ